VQEIPIQIVLKVQITYLSCSNNIFVPQKISICYR